MGDKYPESVTVLTPATVANQWTSITVEIPLLNLPSTGKNARVLEILWIDYEPTTLATTPMYISIGGMDYGGLTIANNPVTSVGQDIRQFEFKLLPVIGSGYPQQYSDLMFANKGALYPNAIFTINTSSGATASNQVNLKIWYRIKSVSLKEYLDIVQMYQVGAQIL